MSLLINIVIIVLTLAVAIRFWIIKKCAYFKNAGAPYAKPSFPMGSFSEMGRKHFSLLVKEKYEEFKGKGPYFGVFIFLKPTAVATDLEFIKALCIKDFSKFQDKGLYYNEDEDPLSAHLFSLDGPKWRQLRHKLSPTFTTGKIKMMYSIVVDVAEKFRSKLIEMDTEKKPIDIQQILTRFTTDVIGSCAFGIDSNSLADENSIFFKKGSRIFREQRHGLLVQLLQLVFPSICKFLKVKVLFDDVSEFFTNVVRDTIAQRKESKVTRNDFLDLLMNMMHKEGEKPDENSFTFNEIAAQAFVFFLAGFETSSTLLTFCLYEVSKNAEIQQKLRDEINKAVAQHDGEMTYDAISDMKYMDFVLNESLRKYPPIGENIRLPSEDYTIQDTNVVIPKDTMIFIPVYSIHHDPEYYPNPEKFDPERFTPENVRSRPQCTFMPFGEGPRNCIGMRFGLMQAKIGLAVLLQTFKVTLNEKTVEPIVLDHNSPTLMPVDKIYVNIDRI